jgi:2-isopropylmalate synthase
MKRTTSTAELSSSTAVRAYDTTLRDGTQREGISLACEDKLRIARRLDALGVAFIEGGFPGSNPKDAEFFARARDVEWSTSVITAFGATRRAGLQPEEDPGLKALIEARTAVCTLFGKTSIWHVDQVLRVARDENLRMIEESVAFLRDGGRRVIYDAEHFFDGYRLDASYAFETLRAAIRGGAEVVVLCDTNGGSLPWDVETIVREAARELSHPIGVHTHDDTGCGVANALAAVRGGARHVQGTINGYGERCGNGNLCAILPALELKLGLSALPPGALAQLYDLAHFVSEVANLAPDEHQAYVGRSAFAHKGGVHVAAMRRCPMSYQHVAPELVGNTMRVIVSELSGRGNVLSKAEELGLAMREGVDARVLERIKGAEARGFSFEAAEASVELMMRREALGYRAPFQLVDYKVMVGQRGGGETYAEATVKITVDDHRLHTAAEGNGPVSALDAALRKALTPIYPQVKRIQLVDYKVRILDGGDGTAATTRVLLDSRDERRTWSTVGASPNIIEASWQALADSIEYGLLVAVESEGEPLHQDNVTPAQRLEEAHTEVS